MTDPARKQTMMNAFPDRRTAIVSGAASERGIGRTTATRLAADGWSIGLIDLDGEALELLADQLASTYGVQTAAVAVDVADEHAVRAAIDLLESRLPPLVGLANIAGVSSPVPYLDLDVSEWRRVLSINLDGVHYVTQRVSESLVRTGVGRIVTLSSVSAQRGGGTYSKAPYSVAKAGVIGLMRAVARELGPFGVTANAIAPGPIDTDIMGGPLTDERRSELAADLPVGRIGTTDDIAAAIAFLLSESSGFMTGQTLNVDGGLYMH